MRIVLSAVNLAYDKPTRMSGATVDSKMSARGNDGNINPDSLDNSCVATPGTADYEWWSVDLLATYMVRNVQFVARIDAASERLKNIFIYTTRVFDPANVNTLKYDLCYNQTSAIPKGHIKPLYCTVLSVGRYVVIMKKTSNRDPLEFCEMEVYGKPYDGKITNYSLNSYVPCGYMNPFSQ